MFCIWGALCTSWYFTTKHTETEGPWEKSEEWVVCESPQGIPQVHSISQQIAGCSNLEKKARGISGPWCLKQKSPTTWLHAFVHHYEIFWNISSSSKVTVCPFLPPNHVKNNNIENVALGRVQGEGSQWGEKNNKGYLEYLQRGRYLLKKKGNVALLKLQPGSLYILHG